ncbi:DUF2809 domain-containing protein [Microbacterium hominis]|uniref:DUF2809 domain-containing protein n=1 Tax=Microbacterium hominis TaxID=162426 RepID=A0A7D4Q1C6_9MICO|nr:DUF2809 domain-containing protein [Microbacterium hominis]QKJ19712.1 DUF2809 domain-containing protein [Microbacterium hominis]
MQEPEPAGIPSAQRCIVAAILLGGCIATGLAVHTLLPDTAATDIAGDALYALAALALVAAIAPRLAPVLAGAIALAWCAGVELFQLTGIPLALGAVFPPAMLVLGTVFDPRDLLVYAVMVAVATGGWVTAAAVTQRQEPRRP